MARDVNYLLKENDNLVIENEALKNKLKEAIKIIESIRKGEIDAVFVSDVENVKVLVADTPDQTYRRFIENMVEGVVTLHIDGIILYANSSFARMIDMPEEKIAGANFLDIISTENRKIIERMFSNPLNNDTKAELVLVNSFGIPTFFIASLSRLQLEDFVAFNLVFTDLTVRKEAEKVLLQVNGELENKINAHALSQKHVMMLNDKLEDNIKTLEEVNIELAKFAYIASHDLQEPLRKIRTFGSILKTDYYQQVGEKGQYYIDRMQNSAERMQHLISDILSYSRLSQKDIYGPTDLQSIVGEILNDLEILIFESKANVVIRDKLPVIEANATQMRQLFQNIISNALKFRRPEITPEIIISYSITKGKDIDKIPKNMSDGDFYVFRISDNGIGFKHEYLDKIFTIFQRLNNKSLYDGTGIGLAICKRIVEKHNGSITAYGKPDEGSVFTIILPVSQHTSAGDELRGSMVVAQSEREPESVMAPGGSAHI